ncbi:unnamed protein product [Arctogadus glacialis]
MLRSRPTSHPRVPEPPETTLSPPRSDGVPDPVVSSTQAAPALSSCCSRFPSPSLLHCNGENWGRSWPEKRTIGVVSSSAALGMVGRTYSCPVEAHLLFNMRRTRTCKG